MQADETRQLAAQSISLSLNSCISAHKANKETENEAKFGETCRASDMRQYAAS